uniref:Uncharacterized protein n=1 Tax=Timema shepardi TaxID=629360 RepID=A0A7R9FYH2_TIMSH|nr:unnamed protein product [Timema shepardi]
MQGRRGTIYHVPDTLGGNIAELQIRKKYSSSRYFYTLPAIIKVIVIVMLMAAAGVFLSTSPCDGSKTWYTWLYPSGTLAAVSLSFLMYVLFVLGLAEDNPKPWVLVVSIIQIYTHAAHTRDTLGNIGRADVGLTLVEAVGVMVVAIMTMLECSGSDPKRAILGPLGLVCAAVLVVSAAASYIMWGRRDEEVTTPVRDSRSDMPGDNPPEHRKSVFI